MQSATVEWFSSKKGYGVVQLRTGDEAFVHRTSIPGDGYLWLAKGESVLVETYLEGEGLKVTRLEFLPSRRQGTIESFEHGTGYIRDEYSGERYFFHWSNVLTNGQRAYFEPGDEVYFYIGEREGRPQAKHVKKRDPRNKFERFAFIHDDRYESLAALAEPEDWTLKIDEDGADLESDSFRLLRNYVKYTFLRLEDEDKVAFGESVDGDRLAAFNTGLVTPLQQEIYGLFSFAGPGGVYEWIFIDWVRDSDNRLAGAFSPRPQLAQYWSNPMDLYFDPSLPLILDPQHFVQDNIDRYPPMFQSNQALAVAATNAAKDAAVARARRNYKTAIPMYHRGEVELMLPLSLDGSGTAQLALLVRRVGNEYLGETVLTLSQALNNARLLARPDRDWLR
ncbi:DUF3825 domain-containing protein [Dermabacter hominis]|uniref:DUF3825 domain-containing protein n=1 Tax=Dermabacter hominis TaxID=36740 RepID=UPI000C76239B|nr:DUF3825 domain-containing protein [Dermabacter hominis]